jgi:phosphatidylserine decarboxylase
MLKIAPEGYPYIVFFFIATLLIFFTLDVWIALIPFILLSFMIFFFRDPERKTPSDDSNFTSPADGRVILIQNVHEDKFLKAEAIEISIFMSPLNVHVNRSPYNGLVKDVVYAQGKFFSAFKPEASLQNENISLTLDTKKGMILIRQIAGFIARRAVCRVKKGETLKKGERFGIIKFSSRVDIYLPKETTVKIKLGQKVRGGETIIGEITDS